MTLKVKEHPEWVHDGSIIGNSRDDPREEAACGGSGFWCHNCGRFWAQDSCGNNNGVEHQNQNRKVKLSEVDGKVVCPCGQQLMTVRTNFDMEVSDEER